MADDWRGDLDTRGSQGLGGEITSAPKGQANHSLTRVGTAKAKEGASIAVRPCISGIMHSMAHITTLTLNPSVDVLTTTAQVMDTHKLRCTVPQYHPGGGGINVARVVHRLGGSVQALWLGGGTTGDQLRDMLDAEAVPHQCIASAHATRMGFSVHETQSGRDFRFVMPGPSADPAALRHILKTLSTPNPDCR